MTEQKPNDGPPDGLVLVPTPRKPRKRKPRGPGRGASRAVRLRPEGLTVELSPEAIVYLWHYCDCGFDAAEAGRRAGLDTGKVGRIRQSKAFRRALGEVLDQEGITPDRIKIALGRVAFHEVDLADLEPYLEGTASLRDLREAGVPTHLVSEAISTPGPHGLSRRVKLADRLAALNALIRVYGMSREVVDLTIEERASDADALERLRGLAGEP